MNRNRKHRVLSLLLVLTLLLGLAPAPMAQAASSVPDTVTLSRADYPTGYSGLETYSAPGLGNLYIHNFLMNVDGKEVVGFCGNHSKTMGNRFDGQPWNNPTDISENVKPLLAMYYWNVENSANFNGGMSGEANQVTNAMVQACVWLDKAGSMPNYTSDKVGWVNAVAEQRDAAYKHYAATFVDIGMEAHKSISEAYLDAYLAGDYGTDWTFKEYSYAGDRSIGDPQEIILGIHGPVESKYLIQKKDTAGVNIGGVTFKIQKEGGTFSTTATTDDSGLARFEADGDGWYTITETSVPSGYNKDTTPQRIKLIAGKTSTINLVNTISDDNPSGGLSIRKVDKDNPSIGLSGAVFEIKSLELEPTIVTTTKVDPESGAAYQVPVPGDGPDGYAYETPDPIGPITVQSSTGGYVMGFDVSTLKEGLYQVRETVAPEGYDLPSDPNARIKTFYWDGETSPSLVFADDSKVQIRFKKVDAETGAGLDGATIAVYKDGEPIMSTTTSGGGYITVNGITEGFYFFEEIAAPAGYALNYNNSVGVHVNAADLGSKAEIPVTMVNYKKPKLTISKTDAITGAVVPGTVFHIKGVDNAYVSDITTGTDGTYTLELEGGSYEVTEKSVPSPYILDAENHKTVWLQGGDKKTLSFENYQLPGLIIKKVGSDGKTIAGAVFSVSYHLGAAVGTYTTDKNGEIKLENLDATDYDVQELSVPEPYILNSEVHHVRLEPGASGDGMSVQVLTVEDTKKPYLTLKKIDAETGAVVAGTVFTVECDGFTDDWTTGADGTVSAYVEPGHYTVTEKSVPAPYYLPDKDGDRVQTITLAANDEKTLVFKNHRYPEITIYKEDSVAGAPIEGAKFTVTYVSDGSSKDAPHTRDFGTLYSDANGQIKLHEQGERLYPGTYTITEVEPAAGFQMKEPSTQTVTILGSESKTVTFKNEPLNAIYVEKIDSVTHLPIEGATFRLRYLTGTSGTQGTVIGTRTTGRNGTCMWANLEAGAYIVEEIDPADGYNILQASETVFIADNGKQEIIPLTFVNVPDGSLLIRKVCSLNPSVTLQDAEFKVTYSDGTVIGDANGIYRTDENGEILIKNLTPNRTVIVTETKAPDGYLIDTQSQVIQINAGKANVLTFKDTPKGKLIITKKDSATGALLSGAEFRIMTAAGCEVGKDGVIGTATLTQNGLFTTDGNGQIILSNLMPGTYVITETKAPAGYHIDQAVTNVTMAPNGDTQSIVITDTPLGSLVIVKKDAATGEALRGVEFEVRTSDGTLVANAGGRVSSNGRYSTNDEGKIVLTDLAPDTYVVTETQTLSGYVLDATPHSIVVKTNDVQTLTVKNVPKGNLIVQKYDKVSGQPLSGAEFKIVTSSGELVADNEGLTSSNGLYTTDKNGQIVLSKLSTATYVVTETKAPKGYRLDPTPQTVAVKANDTQTVNFYDDPLATLTIIKRDVDTKELLSGAAFTVKDGAGNLIGKEKQYVTGVDGTVTLTGLTPDTTVVVSEETPPVGYWNGSDLQTTVLKSGKANSVTFENRKLGTLIIRKFVEGTDNQPIKGVAFRVVAGDGTEVGPDGGVYYTDAKGEIVLRDLQPDIIVKVREIKTVDGYVLDGTPQDIKIVGGQTQQLTFWNAHEQTLTIQKFIEGTTTPIEGVTFLVTDSSGAVLGNNNGEFTTDRNGRIVLTGLTPGTTVTAKEVKTVSGYVLNSTPQSILIKACESQTLTFYNARKGGLIVEKRDSVTNAPLSGAEFKITTISGAYVDDNEGQTSTKGVYKTDANGQIVLLDLAPNTYVVREIKAPAGYVLSNEEQSVKVNANDTQTLTFKNVPLQSVVIQKLIEGSNKPLPGVTFLVTDSSGAPIGSNNGEHITDANGRIVLTGLVPGTVLTIREAKTVKGYALNTTPQTVVVGNGVSGSQIVTVAPAIGGNEITFYDEPLSKLIIHKYIERTANEPLKGVAFKVTDGNGGAVGPNDGVYYTNAEGEIVIPNLEQGTVITVREVKTVEGYVLDGTPKQVEIKSSDAHELTFWNKRAGTLVIRKLDSITKAPISGAEFSVTYADGRFVDNANGHISSNGLYTTDRNGEIVLSGLTGTIVVTEEKAPDGYLLDPNSRTQTVTVNPEDTQTLTFYNTPVGGLQIIKSDESSGKRISGVKFEVRKMNGAVVGQYTTDSNGVIYLPEAESGWYTVTELKAADGYKLDTTPHQIEVKDGEIATLEVTNVKTASLMIHKTDSVTGKGIYGVTFVVYDSGKNPIEQLVTDQDGYAYLDRELTAGKYYVRELEAAEGYLADNQYKTVYVSAGKTSTLEWENTPVTGQIQIIKYAAESNSITGQSAGITLKGAVYEIVRERSGVVIGYMTTDARGVAASNPLPLGRYIIREVTAPAYWQVSAQTFDVTLEYAGQIIRLSDYDKPAELGVTLTKTGNKEVLAGNKNTYRFTIANTSNVNLESFFWHDKLPYDISTASALTTGTYSQRLTYRVLYKTNYNDYRVLAGNLLSTNNYSFALSALPLQYGEVVTDIYFDFGTVPVGFQSVTQPTLTVSVSPTAVNGYYLTNRADAGGKYGGTWQTANASWITIVRNLTPVRVVLLPKTGY